MIPGILPSQLETIQVPNLHYQDVLKLTLSTVHDDEEEEKKKDSTETENVTHK